MGDRTGWVRMQSEQMNGVQLASTQTITPLGNDWTLGVHHYDFVYGTVARDQGDRERATAPLPGVCCNPWSLIHSVSANSPPPRRIMP